MIGHQTICIYSDARFCTFLFEVAQIRLIVFWRSEDCLAAMTALHNMMRCMRDHYARQAWGHWCS